MTTQVALVGGTGKLGRIIHGVIDDLDGFEVRNVLGSASDLGELDGADLIVDASTPAVSVEVVRAALERGINILIGTSGWSQERISLVRPLQASAGTGVVFIPNFSIGSALGTALAATAARFFPFAEIIETHRDTKIDSPSGTAVRTAELMADAREAEGPFHAPHVDQRARGQQVSGIPVHSLRRPGVIARQEAILSGAGETLTIVHDTVDSAAAYAPGIRLALPFARDARELVVGLENVIDLGARS
ncbi:4-hydroxy-tetrahydrodipicolinate reductase [uncultured Microbacterium sp.]|uniref:4-hydroxy-tetrahydrodipicolinate reductase n=1 Tax=uncultured Microbacterium sp. TaxID=191216 RepID=UPI00260A5459|nr:4-hydroxy-tetrahydrodipicolinate reductase [uncultured Microbacterium sp.]